jgi:hypothetical protein
MIPPASAGGPEGDEEDARGRLFWARILAFGFVFGGLFVLSGVLVGGLYLFVWVLRHR